MLNEKKALINMKLSNFVSRIKIFKKTVCLEVNFIFAYMPMAFLNREQRLLFPS